MDIDREFFQDNQEKDFFKSLLTDSHSKINVKLSILKKGGIRALPHYRKFLGKAWDIGYKEGILLRYDLKGMLRNSFFSKVQIGRIEKEDENGEVQEEEKLFPIFEYKDNLYDPKLASIRAEKDIDKVFNLFSGVYKGIKKENKDVFRDLSKYRYFLGSWVFTLPKVLSEKIFEYSDIQISPSEKSNKYRVISQYISHLQKAVQETLNEFYKIKKDEMLGGLSTLHEFSTTEIYSPHTHFPVFFLPFVLRKEGGDTFSWRPIFPYIDDERERKRLYKIWKKNIKEAWKEISRLYAYYQVLKKYQDFFNEDWFDLFEVGFENQRSRYKKKKFVERMYESMDLKIFFSILAKYEAEKMKIEREVEKRQDTKAKVKDLLNRMQEGEDLYLILSGYKFLMNSEDLARFERGDIDRDFAESILRGFLAGLKRGITKLRKEKKKKLQQKINFMGKYVFSLSEYQILYERLENEVITAFIDENTGEEKEAVVEVGYLQEGQGYSRLAYELRPRLYDLMTSLLAETDNGWLLKTFNERIRKYQLIWASWQDLIKVCDFWQNSMRYYTKLRWFGFLGSRWQKKIKERYQVVDESPGPEVEWDEVLNVIKIDFINEKIFTLSKSGQEQVWDFSQVEWQGIFGEHLTKAEEERIALIKQSLIKQKWKDTS